MKSIKQVEIKSTYINKLNDDYNKVAIQRINALNTNINIIYNEAQSDIEINKNKDKVALIKKYADNYKLTIDNAYNLVYNKITLSIVSDMSNSTIKTYMNEELKNFNKYEAKELITKYDYLFANDKYNYQYANVFQSNVSSNAKTNAYDFMYYALEFLSFIIIIFCVVIGANMISGETSGGTMKMLAIRPYKRHKILTGKLTATIFLGVAFLIIGSIATFIIGIRLYGLNSLPVLVVFNAESATTMSAFALFLIFLLTLLLRIIIYTCLALFISTAFKSNIAAIIISTLIYLFSALLGNYLGGNIVYACLPFANVDLFRYLGGDFISSSGNVLGLDFTCPIQPDFNFYISLVINIVFVAILLIATYLIFKKRDIE